MKNLELRNFLYKQDMNHEVVINRGSSLLERDIDIDEDEGIIGLNSTDFIYTLDVDKENFIAETKVRMKEIFNDGDYCKEIAHQDADELLTKLLRALGFDSLVDDYDKISKWYA